MAPLTTYTYSTGSSGSNPVSATDDERLPAGGFNLRHGFPHWFERARTSGTPSKVSSRNTSGSYEGNRRNLRDAVRTPPEDVSSRSSSIRHLSQFSISHAPKSRIAEVLQYLKRSFDDESVLDSLPFEAAGNTGAWKAWRAYRKSINADLDNSSFENDANQNKEWSWDGVWEERVRKGIDASTAEPTLFGSAAAGGDDLVSS